MFSHFRSLLPKTTRWYMARRVPTRCFSRKMPKREFLAETLCLEFVVLDDTNDNDELPLRSHHHQSKPTMKPVAGISSKKRLLEELYKESTDKGSVSLDLNSLNESERRHVQNIFSELVVRKEDLSEEEVAFFTEFEKMLSQNPNYESMSPDDLINSLGLNDNDKEYINQEIKSSLTRAEEELKSVDLNHLLPDAQSSISDFMKGIQHAVEENPSLGGEVSEWLDSVRSKLGNNTSMLEQLSDEDFARIALPPEHLRQALKLYMPQSTRLGDINYDASQDPRDAFIQKKTFTVYCKLLATSKTKEYNGSSKANKHTPFKDPSFLRSTLKLLPIENGIQ